MKSWILLLLATGLASFPGSAGAAGGIQRYALVAGANDGGSDRPTLKYAVSDAKSFAQVLVSLGGVEESNAIILSQPSRSELEGALDELRDRIASERTSAAHRTEVLVYYSGHADEKGLLLAEDHYSYRSLRDRLDSIPADVRIAVLDACASGAITRLKGGKLRPPFMVDESTDMRGHAFLTSSSADEGAQESDTLGASYFTHFLLSGLRGAADTSGEGKVTLNEAYQFAFNETLGHTANTRGGAQHPSYDINISGTGDVVITDLRQTTATLTLAEDLSGRVFVSTGDGQLVVEMHKPLGRRVALALEPGSYKVHCDSDAGALLARLTVETGGEVALDSADFQPTTLEATRRRGGSAPAPISVAGRNRLEIGIGTWNGGSHSRPTVSAGSSTGLLVTGQYSRFLSEELAFTVGVDVLPSESGSTVSGEHVFAGTYNVVFVPVGLRWNPLRERSMGRSLRPYLVASAGPVIGVSSGSYVGPYGVYAGENTQVALGGHLGAAVDAHLGRSWTLGLDIGANLMLDFSRPVGVERNYSGFRAGVRLGWLFGKGHQ